LDTFWTPFEGYPPENSIKLIKGMKEGTPACSGMSEKWFTGQEEMFYVAEITFQKEERVKPVT